MVGDTLFTAHGLRRRFLFIECVPGKPWHPTIDEQKYQASLGKVKPCLTRHKDRGALDVVKPFVAKGVVARQAMARSSLEPLSPSQGLPDLVGPEVQILLLDRALWVRGTVHARLQCASFDPPAPPVVVVHSPHTQPTAGKGLLQILRNCHTSVVAVVADTDQRVYPLVLQPFLGYLETSLQLGTFVLHDVEHEIPVRATVVVLLILEGRRHAVESAAIHHACGGHVVTPQM